MALSCREEAKACQRLCIRGSCPTGNAARWPLIAEICDGRVRFCHVTSILQHCCCMPACLKHVQLTNATNLMNRHSPFTGWLSICRTMQQDCGAFKETRPCIPCSQCPACPLAPATTHPCPSPMGTPPLQQRGCPTPDTLPP